MFGMFLRDPQGTEGVITIPIFCTAWYDARALWEDTDVRIMRNCGSSLAVSNAGSLAQCYIAVV